MTQPSKRAAIYCRVSTNDQQCDRQIRELTQYCHRCDWEIIACYSETASGAKNDRTARKEVMALAQKRFIDVVVVSELSRWGRSTGDLIETLQTLSSWGVSLVALNGFQLDLSTPQGKLIAQILASISEFERDLLRERVRSGLANARANGKQLGRRQGMSERLKQLSPRVRKLRADGMSLRAIARYLQLSKNSVMEILKNG